MFTMFYRTEIFFNRRILQIRQIFFHQVCLCSEFVKVSRRQSFPLYGIMNSLKQQYSVIKQKLQGSVSVGNLQLPHIHGQVELLKPT